MTTLVRWEPFRELGSLPSDMSRLLSGLFDGPSRMASTWVPALDVWETDDAVVYAFDLPGIPEEKISLEVQDGTLTVAAEREKVEEVSDERYYRFERHFGTFKRAIGLPQGVDEDAIAADYRDGVLEIRVPKPVEAQPHKIPLGTHVLEGNGKHAA